MTARHICLWLACAAAVTAAALAQTATETVILAFEDFPQGANPYAPLFRNPQGTLYGTTYLGGRMNLGVVFEVGPAGYKLMYSFKGGSDGAHPYAGVIQVSAGNLYGTTYQGGAANAGVVYKVTPMGQESVLYSFTGGSDGGGPYAGLIADAAGNLYGTTYGGGNTNCTGGCGVVYKVTPAGQETVLHSFTGGTDGANPYAGLIFDPAGNLFGTTYAGGSAVSLAAGNGVVYELSPSGEETTLYAFPPQNQGAGPVAGVIRDSQGNLYGTYSLGGGGVFKLDPAGNYTTLYDFFYGIGAQEPSGNLVRDAAGNLFGTTQVGGTAGVGIVYEITAAGKFQAIYPFPGGPASERDEHLPNAGLVFDSEGNLYGTTPYAGVGGMVYKLSPSGAEAALYSFPAAPGGTEPRAGLVRDSQGNFYGNTVNGGPANAGVIFKVDPAGHETVLYSFTGGADGAYPQSNVALDSAGNLYGASLEGGASNQGTIYKVDTSGRETVLYSFTGGADGGYPTGVAVDPAGNIYGTTEFGGAASKTGLQEGVVFKVDPAGQETVLYSFTGLSDGGVPEAGVIRDSQGNLYGTTYSGGAANGGVVFKLDAEGNESVLFSFLGGAYGDYPYGGVIRDSEGNLYGTAGGAGAGNSGVVYRLSAAGKYSVLYSFTGGTDGGGPLSGVVRDALGNLYGTTAFGGVAGLDGGYGVVYKLDPSGQETVLHSFTGGIDGGQPQGGVVLGPSGDLYGTAPWGGGGANTAPFSGGGVLYRVAQ